MRVSIDKIKKESFDNIGFWMTGPMKTRIINDLIKAFRDRSYHEADGRVLDEAQNFEYKEDGTMGAIEGEHDDNLICTGINYWISTSYLPLPYLSKPHKIYEQPIVGDGMAS